MGFIGKADQIILQLYSEPLQKFRLAAQGHGAVQPPETHRARIETYFDPLPFWYAPFEQAAAIDTRDLPAARRSRSGRWRCIIPGARRTPGCARSTAPTASTCTG